MLGPGMQEVTLPSDNAQETSNHGNVCDVQKAGGTCRGHKCTQVWAVIHEAEV